MRPVEIIALALIVFAVIKIFILLVKPQAWMNFTKALFKKKSVAVMIGLILGGVILYYLIQELTIIQILAATAFVGMLFIIGLAGHVSDFVRRYEREIKAGKFWKKNWFYTLLWVALLTWGFLVLFNVI